MSVGVERCVGIPRLIAPEPLVESGGADRVGSVIKAVQRGLTEIMRPVGLADPARCLRGSREQADEIKGRGARVGRIDSPELDRAAEVSERLTVSEHPFRVETRLDRRGQRA